MATELGRRAPLNDWLSFHRDRLLLVLFQMQETEAAAPGLRVEVISQITGLPPAYATTLVATLVKSGLLTRRRGIYSLTKEGLQWVLESPRR